jgi:osmotically-inducible protein OsmY
MNIKSIFSQPDAQPGRDRACRPGAGRLLRRRGGRRRRRRAGADRSPRLGDLHATDQGIELRAGNRIDEKYRDKVHVNVTSYNRMLLLTGEAPSAEVKADIEKLASGVPNVKSITNELAIAGPSSLGGRSNDTYLTSKVKARFVDANKFSANHVKVVTEAGVVFLLGLVTQTEANDAVEIARTTGGVQKVVRVFEIISAEQARSLDNRPAPAPEAKPAPVK